MLRVRVVGVIAVTLALCASAPALLGAQSATVKVVGSDNRPIPFAWISFGGGTARIADENGTVSLGVAARKSLALEVRRIGYQPWIGKLDVPDTAVVLTVKLTQLAHQLAGVTITERSMPSRLELAGFYDRLLQRQKGALSATFIGPEEIEKRHASRTSDMLYGLNGVVMVHGQGGAICAAGNNGACFMTVLVDGSALRGDGGRGCRMAPMFGSRQASGPDLNDYIDPADLAGIEVHPRGKATCRSAFRHPTMRAASLRFGRAAADRRGPR